MNTVTNFTLKPLTRSDNNHWNPSRKLELSLGRRYQTSIAAFKTLKEQALRHTSCAAATTVKHEHIIFCASLAARLKCEWICLWEIVAVRAQGLKIMWEGQEWKVMMFHFAVWGLSAWWTCCLLQVASHCSGNAKALQFITHRRRVATCMHRFESWLNDDDTRSTKILKWRYICLIESKRNYSIRWEKNSNLLEDD